jgi:hypothetical protein
VNLEGSSDGLMCRLIKFNTDGHAGFIFADATATFVVRNMPRVVLIETHGRASLYQWRSLGHGHMSSVSNLIRSAMRDFDSTSNHI